MEKCKATPVLLEIESLTGLAGVAVVHAAGLDVPQQEQGCQAARVGIRHVVGGSLSHHATVFTSNAIGNLHTRLLSEVCLCEGSPRAESHPSYRVNLAGRSW